MDTLLLAPPEGKRRFASNLLLEAALKYAKRGWKVFPLHNPTGTECSCGKRDCKSSGKHPRTSRGLNDATTDTEMIIGWWDQWPEANIGIATGPGSRIFVLDVDGHEGRASLEGLKSLPDTLRVLTGRKGSNGQRNGFHLYFNFPMDVKLGNRTGLFGKGLDIRAAGGYVVAPPSLHHSGLRYEWSVDSDAIANSPAWLIAEALKPGIEILSAQTKGFLYEGERNNGLFSRARSWRRSGAKPDELERKLREENFRRCKPPLDADEVLGIANSAASYPLGGPDSLTEAWQMAVVENHRYSYDKFLALVHHLHQSRPGLPILLPVERIANLIGCDHTLVSRHRRRAISQGLIKEVKRYVAHETATVFVVLSSEAVSH